MSADIKTATAKYTPTVNTYHSDSYRQGFCGCSKRSSNPNTNLDLSSDKTAKITSKNWSIQRLVNLTDETTVTVAGEGTYTIDPTTGAFTSTPEKDFVGTASRSNCAGNCYNYKCER